MYFSQLSDWSSSFHRCDCIFRIAANQGEGTFRFVKHFPNSYIQYSVPNMITYVQRNKVVTMDVQNSKSGNMTNSEETGFKLEHMQVPNGTGSGVKLQISF